MNPVTPIPPFAPFAPPPAPRILSLRATALSARFSRRLITNEDLPLRSSHFHPYQRNPPPSRPHSPHVHDGPVPSTSELSSKSSVSHIACDRILTPLSSLSPTPDRSISPTPDLTSDLGKVEGPRRNPYRIISSAGISVAPVALPPMKIRLERPKGAGRANLPRILGWDDNLHETVKAVTRKSVVQHLIISLSFKSQDEKKLAKVRQEVVSKYPMLDDYVDMWPLDIIIARLLKYLSSHEKDKGLKEAVERLQVHK